MTYDDFLKTKIVTAPVSGFEVREEEINPALMPHQRDAVMWALKGGRRGMMTELNPEYFRDAVGYLEAYEEKVDQPSLFDFVEVGA